jgi:hypothetical protein
MSHKKYFFSLKKVTQNEEKKFHLSGRPVKQEKANKMARRQK